MPLFKKFSARRREETELEEILNNLNHVLNTKKWFGSMLPDFGIGDYNRHRSRGEVIKVLMEEIRYNIEKYEPRVKVLYIERLESEQQQRLRFEMKCQIMTKDKPLYVTFDSAESSIAIDDM